MIRLSELKVLESAFFRLNLEYNKSSLYPFIEKKFSEDRLFDEESENKLSKYIDNTKDNLAHNVLLNRDLVQMKSHIKDEGLEFDEKKWIKELPRIHKKIEKYLELKFKLKDIHFCEAFPEEYKNFELRGASTITVFDGNKNAGIYYLKKRLDNISTPIHIIHEQIHTCLSQNKDKEQIFIEWFEEGIAILYSLLIYYELTKDLETIRAYQTRSLIFSKVKPEWDFTKRYYEYMKIVPRIFNSGGFELLNQLLRKYLKKDRESINSYLSKIQDNSLMIKYVPKNHIENQIITFSNIIEPEQITPLEYVIVQTLTKPKSIDDISKDINAPLDITKNALNRLFGKAICVLVKENKIDVNWRKKDLFDRGLIKPIFPLN